MRFKLTPYWVLLLLSLVLSSVANSGVSSMVFNASVDLLDANHILHFLDVIDAFGHASVRDPDNSSQFIMSFSVAPALSTSHSLVTYEIDNATAVSLTFNTSITGNNVPAGFSERFIHSEIYRKFPDVASVVHAHTPSVIPFGISHVPLVAQTNSAGSLGSLGTPIFDTATLPPSILPNNQPHDLLVRNSVLGHALASEFITSSSVVLMRGHGMAVRSEINARDVVLRAVFTMQDATAQLQAKMLGGHVTPLSARESQDSTVTFDGLIQRAWDLWTKQVDLVGLYTNDLRPS
ncbi:hypothetical protein K439DRAFT_1343799 [Ramaria rubella]|nr:hypothetical protein K439DRAFT_1343799 [Ramaria rubella]